MEYFKQLRSFVGHSPLILPGSLVIVLNEKRQLLLQNRTDGTWGLPGGLMEIEESLEDAARREVFEETGLKIGTLELVNVFSGPDYFQKLSNGDESYFISALYMTEDISGEIIIEESESKELKFFNINNIPKPEYCHKNLPPLPCYLPSSVMKFTIDFQCVYQSRYRGVIFNTL